MTPKSPAPNCKRRPGARNRRPARAHPKAAARSTDGKKPFVILVAGVNGTGKTTTIGKLAKRLAEDGAKVTLAAGDTFRAAAIEQLRVWADARRRRVRRHQGGRRCRGPGLRGAGKGARQRQRHSADRHGGPSAEQDRADGRTGKDRPRDQEAGPVRAPCGAAGAGCHHRPERHHARWKPSRPRCR